jgi:hypothetical protein
MASNIKIQDLLNKEAQLSNKGKGDSDERQKLLTLIRLKRNEEYRPPCFGDDDCGTAMLSTCAWRMDCGG